MLGDLLFSLRSLARRPGYLAACAVTLGLATSVPFAAFALVDAVLLRPIPLAEPDRVFTLYVSEGMDGRAGSGFVYPELERILGASGVFDAVAGHGLGLTVTAASGGRAAWATFVTERFFDVVGLRPALGRGFTASEHRAGTAPTAIVTDAFWRTRLGADPAAIGRTIRAGERQAAVVGVLPRGGFRGLDLASPADVFLPLPAAQLLMPPGNYFSGETVQVEGRGGHGPVQSYSITARLRPGASAAGAEAALGAVSDELRGRIRLMPAMQAALPAWTRGLTLQFVGLAGAVAALLLLAGCASVAGMMQVRHGHRRREMAVRSWLGAGRLRLVRLCLVEAMLVTGAGAAVGLVAAVWLVQAAGSLVTLPGGAEIPWLPAGWAARFAGLGVLTAAATGVACGLAPALRSVGLRPARLGRWRARSNLGPKLPVVHSSPARSGGGPGLALAGQVAAVVALAIGAGLFVKSLRALTDEDVGVDVGRLAYVSTYFSDYLTLEEEERREGDFYRGVVERLADQPGVEAVTFGGLPLLSDSFSFNRVELDGDVRRLPARVRAYLAGPEYVRTLGLRLLAGRDFGSRDVEGREPVAIVTESLARRLWGERAPIGKRFTSLPLRDLRVVGVVSDGRYHGRRVAAGEFAVFLPWAQNRGIASRWATVIGRTDGDADALAAALQRAVRAFDGDLPINEAGTLRDRLGALAGPQRLGAAFLGALGGFALLIAVAGVYGSVAQTAAGRTRELGIRIALGASRSAVAGAVLRRTLAQVGVGVAAGIVAAGLLSALAEPHLFEVDPRDPAVYAAVALAVAAASALAGLVAAFRALRESSVNALIREVAAAE